MIDMELRDTVNGMLSANHLERLEAEFEQVRIRAWKLCEMLMKWDLGMLDFTPTCPKELLKDQYDAMIRYAQILNMRITLEKKAEGEKE